jgi:hypothetical protein
MIRPRTSLAMNVIIHVMSSARRAPFIFLVAALICVTALACGPVQSTSEISAAEGYLERARVNDAEVNSPYEYHRAQLYLYKAKQEWGYSNFEKSRDYANEARRSARAAIDNSREAPWRGHPIFGFEVPDDLEQYRQDLEDSRDLDDVDELELDD